MKREIYFVNKDLPNYAQEIEDVFYIII